MRRLKRTALQRRKCDGTGADQRPLDDVARRPGERQPPQHGFDGIGRPNRAEPVESSGLNLGIGLALDQRAERPHGVARLQLSERARRGHAHARIGVGQGDDQRTDRTSVTERAECQGGLTPQRCSLLLDAADQRYDRAWIAEVLERCDDGLANFGIGVVEVTEQERARVRAARVTESQRRRGAHGGLDVFQRAAESGDAAGVAQHGQHLGGGLSDTRIRIAQPLRDARPRFRVPDGERRVGDSEPNIGIRIRE